MSDESTNEEKSDRKYELMERMRKVYADLIGFTAPELLLEVGTIKLTEVVEDAFDTGREEVEREVKEKTFHARLHDPEGKVVAEAVVSPFANGTTLDENEIRETIESAQREMDEEELLAVADAVLLYESGLLFEVNRRVLHPLGLALAIETTEGTSSMTRISPRLRRTENVEGIQFTDEALENGYRRYHAFMNRDGFKRLARRYEKLGFRGQVPEDVDPNSDEMDWGPTRLRVTRKVATALLLAARVLEAARAQDWLNPDEKFLPAIETMKPLFVDLRDALADVVSEDVEVRT